MPFYLPALSRRRFLGSLAGFCAVLSSRWGGRARAAAPEKDWALLADTHISKDGHLISRGANMRDNLSNTVREIVSLQQVPGSLLINGDCAFEHGEIEDYQAFTDLLGPLRAAGIPVHLTAGNHDHRDHLRDALVSRGHRQEFT